MRDDFAVFIITHGRAKEQRTLETLQNCGYTGRLYLIIDDEDQQLDEYMQLYGDCVVKFSKREIEPRFDTMTNKKEYRAAVYARNASYQIAKALQVRWIFMCDDDISRLDFRIPKGGKLLGIAVRSVDHLFERMCEVAEHGRLGIFGFSQAGAFIGDNYLNGCQRKVSQAMLFDAHNPIKFRGIFYEDLLAALDAGRDGKAALSTMLVSCQSPVQATNRGGMQDLYEANSTYIPCFHVVMAYPNAISISEKSGKFKLRLKHSAFAPMIISERWRK